MTHEARGSFVGVRQTRMALTCWLQTEASSSERSLSYELGGGLMPRVVRGALVGVVAISAAACVFHRVEVQPLKPANQITIVGPVKAHLRDGATVVYAPGVVVIVIDQTVRGAGVRYNYALTEAARVEEVPLDMVVEMERFGTVVNRPASIAASIAASYAAIMSVLLVLFAVAVQGQ